MYYKGYYSLKCKTFMPILFILLIYAIPDEIGVLTHYLKISNALYKYMQLLHKRYDLKVFKISLK